MTAPDQPSTWDRRFLEIARLNASWSKDPSTKVGAVIVGKKNRIVSLGFNGFPSKIPDEQDWLNDRDIKYDVTIHAELNAILSSTDDLTGCTLYVWPIPPCSRCSVNIIQTGITRVVTVKPPEDKLARWEESFKFAQSLFKMAEVEYNEYDIL